MTLIIDGNHAPSSLVMCTSDSRSVRYSNYDEKGSDGEPRFHKNRNNKVIKLTDKVLLRSGGVRQLCNIFIKRLKRKVKGQDSLDQCREYAKDIYNEMIAEHAKGKGSYWLKYLDDERGLPVALNGFYDSGKPGLVIFTDGEWLEFKDDEWWVTSMVAPPSKDGNKAMGYLDRFSRIAEPGTQHMFAEFWEAHKYFFKENPKVVSEDMHIHLIKKINGEYIYIHYHLPDVTAENDAIYIYKNLMDMDSQINLIPKIGKTS